jgi:hypothetical protein
MWSPTSWPSRQRRPRQTTRADYHPTGLTTDYSSTLPTPSCSPSSLMTLAYSTPIKPTTHRRAFAPLQIHHGLGRRLLWNPPQMGLKLACRLSMPGYVRKPYSDLLIPIQPTPMPPANGQSPTMVPNNSLPITTPTAQPFQPRLKRLRVVGTPLLPCHRSHHARSAAPSPQPS